MSLGIVIKGPEGVVLASDTRVTVTRPVGPNQRLNNVNFDNASKMLTLDGEGGRAAAVTQGQGTIEGRTIHSFLPEFQAGLTPGKHTVRSLAQTLSEFFMERWPRSEDENGNVRLAGGNVEFIVGGIDYESPYGDVYRFRIPSSPSLSLPFDAPIFGMSWGGQTEIVQRLILGIAPSIQASIRANLPPDVDCDQFMKDIRSQNELSIPYESLPLQDCVDLAILLIRTTMEAQSLSVGQRGVGGTIEVVTITPPGGVQWVQKREIHGER